MCEGLRRVKSDVKHSMYTLLSVNNNTCHVCEVCEQKFQELIRIPQILGLFTNVHIILIPHYFGLC